MLTLTFHGHACFLVEADGQRILLDPYFTGNPQADITADRLPKIDAILVSHGHDDHLGDALPLAKRDGATIVTTSELARFCRDQGAKAHSMHIGGSHQFPWGRVKLVPAFHGGSVEGDTTGRYTTAPCGLVLTVGGVTVYHTGDTGLTIEMQLLEGRVDVMLLPIGDNYTMGIEDAVRAVDFVKPQIAVPMHFNTYDVIRADPQEFRRKVGNRADVVILKPGESLKRS
jgi:L-ascorbate metabolism protein UlaG (beta-lactamase superfamily)